MPPKKASTTAAAPAAKPSKTSSAAATKKAPAPAKKAAPKKASATSTGTSAKPTANSSRKRKAAQDDDADIPALPPKKKAKAKSTATATKKSATTGVKKSAAPAKKAVSAKKSTPAPVDDDKENLNPTGAKANGKRKRTEEPEAVEDGEDAAPAAKKVKPAAVKKETAPRKIAVPKKVWPKIGVKINEAPTAPLDVYVFGEGSSGELGLGSKRSADGKKPIDVKRPRLNPNLSAKDVGVVQIACGGMHVVVLTKDNKILTWGVNDQGALGRDTNWEGGLRDADADDSDEEDEDDTGVNPKESTPAEIDTSDIAPDTKFVQVVASDSATFALTEDGRVYGWGTFRAADGILGFSPDVLIQKKPLLLADPKKIVRLAAGSNHIMALDNKGKIHTWGTPEQNQLGRRCVQRDIKDSALRPGGIAFKRGTVIEKIACGSYHSFAVDKNGKVYAWGLNNFGELGIEQGAGQSEAVVLEPTLIESLSKHTIVEIAGGEHHSLACTEDGKLITWGRIDGYQTGLSGDKFTEANTIFDEHQKPRILKVPTVVDAVSSVATVAAGTDNSFAITTDGKAYSWGFSANYQTGQGTGDDIETPTLIDNTAVRGKKLVYAGAGGQYSVLASVADAPMINGA